MSENQLTVKRIFERDSVKQKIVEMLGTKATGFITSVLQVSSNNALLAKADPKTVYNAAMMAAALDLPINQNLGFAWIVPYKGQAQFQMGWKGYVQLAQRTGQYLKINVTPVYENQFETWNSLTEELKADFSIHGSGKIVGYAAYFKLINGFEKTVYWSHEKVFEHAKRFSQSFNQSFSPWKSDFDAMAMKTVLKHTLSKWGILSIEMQKANISDQAVVNDYETQDVDYVDYGTPLQIMTNEEFQKAKEEIEKGNTTVELITSLYDLTAEQLIELENGSN